jgi:uncharacterized RDD family membrane protein YckC
MSQSGDGGAPPPYGWQPTPPEQPQQYPPAGAPGYGPPPGYGQPPAYGPPPGYGQPPTYGPPPGYGMYPPAPPAYGYGYGAPVPGGRLAGMGARFGGLVVDAIIPAIVGAFTGSYSTARTCDAFGNGCTTNYHFGTTWIVDLLGLALGVAYSAYFVGTKGQTPGHRVAGIRIVDVNTGGVIGPGRGALRWLVLSLTGAVCTLGYWSPFFDSRRRQGWHDKATNAVAIPARQR